MRFSLPSIGLVLVPLLATGAAAYGATDRPAAAASKALAQSCTQECYLNLASHDGGMRTVLVRNGAGVGESFAFEIIARGPSSEWEGLRVSKDETSVSRVVGWKEYANVDDALTAGSNDFRTQLRQLTALVRRDQVAANAEQSKLQSAVIHYLVELGYVGQ